MAWVEVLPEAPTKVEGTKPLFDRPAGYVAYVPPPIPDAVPETALAITEPEPEFIPVFDGVLGWFTTWCLKRNRRQLQRGLADIIRICQDHEANGVKAGDPVYKHLYAKALDLCYLHFDKWRLNRDHVEIEIPCMRQLRLLASPEATVTARRAPLAIVGLVAIVALPLVVGAWCGLFGVGQRWIVHLLGG
jgi:hypothetical protein